MHYCDRITILRVLKIFSTIVAFFNIPIVFIFSNRCHEIELIEPRNIALKYISISQWVIVIHRVLVTDGKQIIVNLCSKQRE